MRHSSYDENGPLIGLGKARFSTHTDLPSGRAEFDIDAFLVASDESEMIVEYNGFRLKGFGVRNDYYGFGSSPRETLTDAQDNLKTLEGCNCDIKIVTTLKLRPCFISDDKPFYGGAQRVHHIPMTWRDESGLCKEQVHRFTVWQNGKPTEDAGKFFDEIQRLSAQDAAPTRKGELRTILNRKQPLTRDSLLIFSDT